MFTQRLSSGRPRSGRPVSGASRAALLGETGVAGRRLMLGDDWMLWVAWLRVSGTVEV